uniref:Uncharacterized protein n=1 Tax=Gouania willdenowi TaxID=441366 RepID=A0A8C5HZJ1_GOUWI
MAHFDTEYQRLEASYSDSPPGEENLLMHVPEGAKWYILLNSSYVYNLHQKNGFTCILSLFTFSCSQLLFVVGFTVFLSVNHTDSSKVTLPDAFLPMDVCSARWGLLSVLSND